jgi:hypothetical protein
MTEGVPEADWKVFREIREEALQRFCARTREEVAGLCAEPARRPHDRYRDVVQLLRDRDRELAGAIDDLRRSRMHLQLAAMVSLDLLRDEELQRLSSPTLERLRLIAEVRGE